ncbi:MAG: signal peptidase I [Deltaproteobacteria bacterium]|nr:signal peptidase I [Deltaproteobacteria bacterium]
MLKKALVILLIMFFFCLGAAMFLVKLYTLPSGSMAPNIEQGEKILLFKLAYGGERKPSPGEVVVFSVPGHPGRQLIKRVVAIAGERVGEKRGVLTINNEPVGERLRGSCWIKDNALTKQQACVYFSEKRGQARYRVIRDAPLRQGLGIKSAVVKEHHVYLLGDNRDNSMDSRHFGAVHEASIIGRVLGK